MKKSLGNTNNEYLEAVKQNGYALEYVQNQTLEIYLASHRAVVGQDLTTVQTAAQSSNN